MDAARTEATDRVRLQQMLDELVAAGAMGALAQFRDGDSTWDGSSRGQITEPTASKDLQRLVEGDLLVPHGQKRARFYTASDRVMEIRRALVAGRGRRNARSEGGASAP